MSELASELAAVREQEQAKCTTGERLQETLTEERIQKRMRILEGRMLGVSELAAEQDRTTRQQHHKTTVQVMSAVAELGSEQDRRIRATAVQVEKRMKEHWRLEDWAIKCGYHRDGEYA